MATLYAFDAAAQMQAVCSQLLVFIFIRLPNQNCISS